MPNAVTTHRMICACSEYLEVLERQGVAPDVALDRTWDAYEAAWLGLDRHAFDPRDQLFEGKLRTIAAAEQQAKE